MRYVPKIQESSSDKMRLNEGCPLEVFLSYYSWFYSGKVYILLCLLFRIGEFMFSQAMRNTRMATHVHNEIVERWKVRNWAKYKVSSSESVRVQYFIKQQESLSIG